MRCGVTPGTPTNGWRSDARAMGIAPVVLATLAGAPIFIEILWHATCCSPRQPGMPSAGWKVPAMPAFDASRALTRSSPPSAFENQLGDALEKVFEAGATTLQEVVAKLNEMGAAAPDGSRWTEDSFQSEMHRLAEK